MLADVMEMKLSKETLKAIEKNGFVSYPKTAEQVKKLTKRDVLHTPQVRAVVIALHKAGKLPDTVTLPNRERKATKAKVSTNVPSKAPTANKASTKPKTGLEANVTTPTVGASNPSTKSPKAPVKAKKEILTTQQVMDLLGVKKVTEKHVKEMESRGYKKVKSAAFPFPTNYVKEL